MGFLMKTFFEGTKLKGVYKYKRASVHTSLTLVKYKNAMINSKRL